MAKLHAWLERIFDIRTGEWKRLLWLYTFAFLLNTSVVWGQAASYALFLEKSGAENLPFMFIADALLTALAILIYGAFVDRVSNTRLMNIICLGGSVLLLVLYAGLHAGVFLVYPIMFLLERVWRALISIHSWTYIADFYDTRMAKRHFPLIGSGSRTSGILSGLLLIPIVIYFDIESLVLAWSTVLLISGLCAWTIPRLVRYDVSARRSDSRKTRVMTNYHEGFKAIQKSPFLRLMAVTALISTLVIYLLEFEAQSFLEHYFRSSANDLGVFYGMLETIGNLITLPIQVFLLSRIITWLGVGNANLIFPSLSALAYGALVAVPSLFSASFARINHTSFRSAFRTPIDGLLFNAVSPTFRGRARAFINGLLIPLGALLAGCVLVLVRQEWIPASILVVPGIVIALVYVYLGVRLRTRYTQSILSLLQDDEMAIFRLSRAELHAIDPTTLALLQTRLEESDSDETTIILAEILYDIQGAQAIPLLHKIATRSSAEVRATILLMFSHEAVVHPLVRSLCLDGLTYDHVSVREAAVTVLEHAPHHMQDRAVLDRLSQMVDEQDDTLRVRILPMLISSGIATYQEPASQIANTWLNSTDAAARMRGLHVLAQVGDERLLDTIRVYCDDPSPTVRCESVILIGDMLCQSPQTDVRHHGLDILQSYIVDDDDTVRLAVVQTLARLPSFDMTESFLMALADERFQVRRQACEVVATRSYPMHYLERALESDDVYLVESAAFILVRTGHHRIRRVLFQVMEQLVEDTHTLRVHSAVLQAFSTPASHVLIAALADEGDVLIERFFWLLRAVVVADDDVQTLCRSLRRTNSVERANAIEALESQTSPRLARLIVPLLNASSPDVFITQARDTLNQTIPTAWQVVHFLWPQFVYDDELDVCLGANLERLYRSDWLQALTISTVTMELATRNELAHPAFDDALRQTIQDEQLSSLL